MGFFASANRRPEQTLPKGEGSSSREMEVSACPPNSVVIGVPLAVANTESATPEYNQFPPHMEPLSAAASPQTEGCHFGPVARKALTLCNPRATAN